MSIESALAACEETVRARDPDRYVAALFAPSERRPLLFALYAFNHELARIGETVKEPMLADIRLEWWREAVEGARDGRPRDHDVARALAELFARSGPPLELFETMIAARRRDVEAQPFADLAALEAYADATAGNLMRIAARLLDEREPDEALLAHAGKAFALTGLLRMAANPAARLKRLLASDEPGSNNASVARIAARARFHHAEARKRPKPGRVLAAVLPAALVPLYERRIRRGASEPPLYRRQLVMLGAAIRGQI